MPAAFISLLMLAAQTQSATASAPASSPKPLSIVETDSFRLPAEWEPQECLLVSWPLYDHRPGASNQAAHVGLIKAASRYEPVHVLVPDLETERLARLQLKGSNVNLSRVKFVRVDYQEIWMRDFGPTFLVDDKGKRRMVDYRFNYWGYKTETDPESKAEEGVDRQVARKMGIDIAPVTLVSEGGNRESNGKGTLMLVESVEKQRNPGLSLEQIEEIHLKVLGAKKIIWLKQGVREDDFSFMGPLPGGGIPPITTGGHVDNVARFIGPRTVALAEVTAKEAQGNEALTESRRRLEENFEILKKSTDQDGRPIQVVRIPAPDLMFEDLKEGTVYDFLLGLKYQDGTQPVKGQPIKVVLAASYMNFVILNKAVLVSNFAKSGSPASTRRKDLATLAALRRAFPTRKIVPVDSYAYNLGGGGLHCITMQVPSALTKSTPKRKSKRSRSGRIRRK